ncbi:MAG: YgiT-type zinc finger protein [Dehalococcoidia bacterium]
MRCVICHGSKIEAAEVNEESKVGNDVVYVPVKVLVCQTCGERYYDRRTMQFLEETERKLSTGEPRLREIGKVLIYD